MVARDFVGSAGLVVTDGRSGQRNTEKVGEWPTKRGELGTGSARIRGHVGTVAVSNAEDGHRRPG